MEATLVEIDRGKGFLLGARHVDAIHHQWKSKYRLGKPAQTVIRNFKTEYKTGYEIEVQLITPIKDTGPSQFFRFNV